VDADAALKRVIRLEDPAFDDVEGVLKAFLRERIVVVRELTWLEVVCIVSWFEIGVVEIAADAKLVVKEDTGP